MQKLKFRVALKSLKINIVTLDRNTMIAFDVDNTYGDVSDLVKIEPGVNYIMELVKE